MNKYTFYFLTTLFVSIHTLQAQTFSEIDSYAQNIPFNESRTIEKLADYLNKKANNDTEKIRAYYVWLSHNISYDVKTFLSGKIPKSTAKNTLKQKKAVCQGYSELFKALCDHSNIPCFVVSGYSKGYGFNPNRRITNPDHAWNVAKVDNKWYLIDATWGAGYLDEKQRFQQKFTDNFFMPDPKDFILKHLPSDPMWQLLPCPISVEDFRKTDDALKTQLLDNKNTCFNYNDTISAFQQLSLIDQKVNSAERAFRFNPDNVEVPGFAYLNLAYELSQQIAPLYDEKNYKKALEINLQVLKINERAYYYLRKSKSAQSKNAAEISRQNIKQLKEAIKSIEEALR